MHNGNRYRRMLDHMEWADLRVLGTLRARGPEAPPASLRRLAHLLAAEEVWLLRLRGEDSTRVAIWPESDLEVCAERARELHEAWRGFLSEHPEGGTRPVRYRTGAGGEYTTHPADILTHVFMHGAHHRGQILSDLRASGTEPGNVDFITYVRELQGQTGPETRRDRREAGEG